MKTVIKPFNINVIVATNDRIDARDNPHTPWPLVHPFPRTTPNPTRRPAELSMTKLFDTVWLGISPKNTYQIGPAINKPMINKIL